jgi:microcin C transport system substrate-binding protein
MPSMPLTRRLFTGSAALALGALPMRRILAQAASAREGYGAPTYFLPSLDRQAEYPRDFPHWNYVDPAAPKGGALYLGAFGSFDTLNDYSTQGTSAAGISLIYDALITANLDEFDIYYADVAETIEVSDDQLSLIATMRRDVRFHDGQPMTAADVVFTQNILRDKGSPFFRARFYDDMESIEMLDDHTVKFTRKNLRNPQLLKALASFPILPKHWWETRDFDSLTMEPLLGSGPYKIRSIDSGRAIVYERVPDYWGRNLPQNIGQSNFDEIHYQYFLDESVRNEAFKAGQYDFLDIPTAQEWVTGYKNIKAIDTGALKLEEIPTADPQAWRGFAMNLRREAFADARVRRGLNYLFDFETLQKTSYFGLFKRCQSYFPNSDLAFRGLPEGRELEILETYRGRIADEIFTTEFKQPTTAGDGNIRANLRAAIELFRIAGWELEDGRLVNVTSGRPMRFEIAYFNPETEKAVLPFVQNLRRAGIEANPRLLDVPQFRSRINEFQFDMMYLGHNVFYPPGQELRGGWNSKFADHPGDENSSGIKDPIIDELVEMVIAADTWAEKTAAGRAFDRYATWQFFDISNYYDPSDRIGYWDMVRRPARKPKLGIGFPTTWWFDDSNPAARRGNRR